MAFWRSVEASMLRRRAGAEVCLEMAFSKITADASERKGRAKAGS